MIRHAGRHDPKVYRARKDHLVPLICWFAKSVGRPWNDVFVEACRAADHRSLAGWQLRLHLDSLVETDPIRISAGCQDFYADPETRILQHCHPLKR